MNFIVAQCNNAHWVDTPQAAGINPNGGLAGLRLKFSIDHPVVDRLETCCWQALERMDDVHDASEALLFLAHARARDRAERMAAKLVHALPTTRMFKVDPTAPGDGLDALFYAPTPDAFAATWLDRKLIGTALNHLEAQQQPDGGWPISWTPPAAAALSEWRGITTVKAVRTLRAYGRI